jgi:hypothetical protein
MDDFATLGDLEASELGIDISVAFRAGSCLSRPSSLFVIRGVVVTTGLHVVFSVVVGRRGFSRILVVASLSLRDLLVEDSPGRVVVSAVVAIASVIYILVVFAIVAVVVGDGGFGRLDTLL